MNTDKWIRHFAANNCPEQIDWSNSCVLDKKKKHVLAKSLATFQLGESGEGTALFRFAERLKDNPKYKGYKQALEAFIKEENRHALMLADMVHYVHGTLIDTQWTDFIFRRLRKFINLEFELLVLLTAELIAESYYELLRRQVNDPNIRQACARIVKDEIGHTGFHAEFFRSRRKDWNIFQKATWDFFLFLLTETTWRIVWLDHKSCFKAFGISKGAFSALMRKARIRWLRRRDRKSLALDSNQKNTQNLNPAFKG